MARPALRELVPAASLRLAQERTTREVGGVSSVVDEGTTTTSRLHASAAITIGITIGARTLLLPALLLPVDGDGPALLRLGVFLRLP